MSKTEFKILFFLFAVSFLLVIGGWIPTQFLDSKSGEFIIRWDNLGISKIGGKSSFLIIELSGIWIVGLNFLLFLELRKKDRFLGILTAVFTFFLSILIFVVFMAIISVN